MPTISTGKIIEIDEVASQHRLRKDWPIDKGFAMGGRHLSASRV
jgi:hypothetical protein